MESIKKIPLLILPLFCLLMLIGFVSNPTLAQNEITFQVDMSWQNSILNPDEGDMVVVRGNFNGWSGEGEILTDPEPDNIYAGTFDVGGSAGDEIQYKFAIHKSDGSDIWETDIDNRIFFLTGSPETLPVVYFNDQIGNNILVTNTDDSGPGSLRYAIDIANSDGVVSIIEFDPGLMMQGIIPETELPALVEDFTTIDGDINDDGLPDIRIGSDDWKDFNGLIIESAYNTVRGLVINYFRNDNVVRWAMIIRGGNAHNNIIAGCYIGTNMIGLQSRPNRDGILISGGAHDNIVGGSTPADRNLISGNDRLALVIQDFNSNNNVIRGNYIGTNISGEYPISNNSGIAILYAASNNVIGGSDPAYKNVISGNRNHGIYLLGENTNDNIIIGNYIGTDINGNSDIGNQWGILISNGPKNNIIGGSNPGEENIISYNVIGIQVEGGEFETSGNTITRNSITRNGGKGISLQNGGNNEIGVPDITEFDGSFLRGSTTPNSTVEIFADELEEGAQYLGSVQTDNEGNFEFGGPFPGGYFYNATVTDGGGNTSEFAFSRFLLPVNQTEINANRWRVQLANDGGYSRDQTNLVNGGGSGGEFPKGSGIYILYSAGQYLGAMKDGIPSVSHFDHNGSDFVTGKIINETPAPINNLQLGNLFSENNRVFVIDTSRSGYDWDNWPVEYGAPVDANGDPLLMSKQDSWTVFNDLLLPLHTGGGNPVLGVEIQRSTYTYTFPGAPSDVFFVKWKITNKSNNNYENTYFGAWFDPDVDGANQDVAGTDTTLNMTFVYNLDNSDAPEAFGSILLKGPIDDGKMIGLTSTSTYPNGQDLNDDFERYNILQGLDRWGNQKQFGPFDYTGDPVTSTGVLDWQPADKRILLNSGPFTLYAGNTQEVIIACIGAVGNDRLDAVAKLKETAQLVRKFYDRPTITLSATKGVRKFKTPVRVELNNVKDFLGADIKILYDKNVLTLSAADVVLSPLTSNFVKSINVNQTLGIVSVGLASSTPLNIESPGVLIKVPFKVANNAPIGNISNLLFSEALMTLQDDSLRINLPMTVDGSFEIVDGVLFGDVNQNGAIDLVDAIMVLKVLVQMLNEVTPFQELLADADKNGTVNLTDALIILNQIVLNKSGTNKSGSTDSEIPDSIVTLNINLPDLEGEVGDEVIVPVRSGELDKLFGIDLEFSYDPLALQLRSVTQSGSSDLIASNQQIPGRLYAALVNQDGIGNTNGDLVNLVFKILKEGQHTLTVDKSSGLIFAGNSSNIIPDEYMLYQNYPNPFNPTTTIKFDLPEAAHVVLKIYTVLGEEVATLINEEKQAGRYKLNFDASGLASGVYIYRIKANGFVNTKKTILLK